MKNKNLIGAIVFLLLGLGLGIWGGYAIDTSEKVAPFMGGMLITFSFILLALAGALWELSSKNK